MKPSPYESTCQSRLAHREIKNNPILKVCLHHECLKSEKQNVVAKLSDIIFFLIELAGVSNTYTAFPGP